MAELDELDRRVAEIEGWEFRKGVAGRDGMGPLTSSRWVRGEECWQPWPCRPPSYTRDPQWWGPLIERYHIELDVEPTPAGGVTWRAWPLHSPAAEGHTPAIAVCRAIIARYEAQEEARHD